MELEPNLLDWNVNELESELELEDMKRTKGQLISFYSFFGRSYGSAILFRDLLTFS